MARDVDYTCHAFHAPYVCAKMVVPSPLKDDVVTDAKAAMALWSEGRSAESGFAISSEALAWLMSRPPQLSALARAARCSVPATCADIER